MNIQKLRDMNLHDVADELEKLREFKAKVEKQEPRGYELVHSDAIEYFSLFHEVAQAAQGGGEVVPVYANPIPAAKPAPEHKGWYCAQCQCGVDPSEVTYNEAHTVCGRIITDDEPPVRSDRPASRQDIIDVLLATRGQSEGVTADAILGLFDKPAVAVPDDVGMIPMINGKPKVTGRMKVECIGEFSWREEAPYYDENGELHDHVATHEVPWDVCKEIYKRMASAALLAAPSHSQQGAPAVAVPDDMLLISREILERVRDTLEFWINREDRSGMSESDYKTWLSLGHRSKGMTILREALDNRTSDTDRCPSHESEQSDSPTRDSEGGQP